MKPPIQLVNEDDEVIGLGYRETMDYAKDRYRVAALWMTNSKGEVLLAQRKHTKDRDPDKWGPAVAGTIEEGETYESNIYKETEEEIGLVGVKFAEGPKMKIDTPRRYFCQWFTVTLDRPASSFSLEEDEVEALAWVPLQELLEELKEQPEKFLPTMTEVLRTLYPSNPV